MKRTQTKAILKSAIPDGDGNVFLSRDGQATTTSTAPDIAINAQGRDGANKVGGDLNLCGGKPTGNGNGGSVVLRTAAPGASGTTQRALADRMEVDTTGVCWISNVSAVPTVGRSGKVGLFVDGGVLKAILPDNSVEIVAYEE